MMSLPTSRRTVHESCPRRFRALWLRFPILVALLALIAWCTTVDRRDDNPLSYYRVI